MNRPRRITLTRNRGYAYFWLMLFPRPVRVAYLVRRALSTTQIRDARIPLGQCQVRFPRHWQEIAQPARRIHGGA
jgi:hypothetical protein